MVDLREARTDDLIALRADLVKYSPDQPRDDHGRWTSDGGGAADRSDDGSGHGPPLGESMSIHVPWADATAAKAFFDAKYPGRVDKSWFGPKADWARTGPALAAMDAVMTKFPEVVKAEDVHWALTKFPADEPGTATLAVTVPSGTGSTGTSEIKFNSAVYGTGAKLDVWQMAAGTNWWIDGTANPAGTVWHEFGHAYWNSIIDKNTAPDGSVSTDRAMGAFQKFGPVTQPPSGYGATDPGEWFAEAFNAAYNPDSQQRGDDAATLVSGIVDWESAHPVTKYSDGQPRDDHGRWTSGGADAMTIGDYRDRHPDLPGQQPSPYMSAGVIHALGLDAPVPTVGPGFADGNPGRASMALDTLDYLQGQFPQVNGVTVDIRSLDGWKVDQNTTAGIAVMNDIYLNKNMWGAGTEWPDVQAAGWAIGFSPGDVVTHEFGHVVDHELLAATSPFSAEQQSAYRDWRDTFLGTPGAGASLSAYAGTDRKEAVAECFAAAFGTHATAAANPWAASMRDLFTTQGIYQPSSDKVAKALRPKRFARRARAILRRGYVAAYRAGVRAARSQIAPVLSIDDDEDEANDYDGLDDDLTTLDEEAGEAEESGTGVGDEPDDTLGEYEDEGEDYDFEDTPVRERLIAAATQQVDDASDTSLAGLMGLGTLLSSGQATLAQVESWLGGYASSVHGLYQLAFGASVAALGELQQATWQAEDDGATCAGCAALDGQTWNADEDHPWPGDSPFGGERECGPNCRCALLFEVIPTLDGQTADQLSADGEVSAADVPDDIAAAAMPTLIKYSEDEARDDHGRWTNGGGSVNDTIYSTRESARVAMAKMTPNDMAAYVTQRTGTEVRTWGRRVNREAFREAMAQYVALHDQFPWVPVKSIAVAPTGPRMPGVGATIAQTRWSGYTPDSTINLSPSQWATSLTGRDTGFLTRENANPAGYMTHEFGHALDHARLFNGETTYPDQPSGWRDGAFHSLPPISGYGATSTNEKFAELFAGTYASPSAPPDQQAAMQTYVNWLATTTIRKYSDDQPRDDHGRWSADGSDAGGGAEALKGLAARFPGPGGHPIATLERAALDPTTEGQTLQPNNTSLTLAGRVLSTIQINSAIVDEGKYPSQRRGWDITGVPKTTATVVTHEFGHAVENVLNDLGLDPFHPSGSNLSYDYASLYRDVISHPLSGYGRANATERFAEAFSAAYSPGSKATDLPAAVAVRDFMDTHWTEVTDMFEQQHASLTKYSDAEPRDDHGRWSTDGGGASEDYRGGHTAPGPSYGAPLHRLDNADDAHGAILPADIYDRSTQLRYYGTGADRADRESFAVVNSVRGKPDAPVTMYRAAPRAVGHINAGDWVTLSPTYAQDHLDGTLGGDGHVLSSTVPAHELWTNGDSINEFGWHPDPENADLVKGMRLALALLAGEQVATADLLELREVTIKYSDDQARDDHGRWTGGGASGELPGTTTVDAAWTALDANRFQPNGPGGQREQHPENYAPNPGFGDHLRLGAREWRNAVDDHGLPIVYQVESKPWADIPIEDRQTQFLPSTDPDGTLVGAQRVPGSEQPLPYVYRVMSTDEWNQAQERGYFQSDGRMNLGPNEGTVASTRSTGDFYAPTDRPYRVVEIALNPADGWRVDPVDEYVKTSDRVPFAAAHAWSQEISAKKDALATVSVDDLLAERERLLKYSDDQPRDDHGRWSSEGGDAASSADHQSVGSHAFALNQQHFGGPTTAPHDPQTSGTLYDAPSLSSCNPEVVVPAMDTIAGLQQQFPDVPLSEVTADALRDGRAGEYHRLGTLPDADANYIALDQSWFSQSRAAMESAYTRTPGWTTVPTPEGVAAHEFGHAVWDYIEHSQSPFAPGGALNYSGALHDGSIQLAPDGSVKSVAEGHQAQADLYALTQSISHATGVSGYADSKGSGETWAEVFSAAMSPDSTFYIGPLEAQMRDALGGVGLYQPKAAKVAKYSEDEPRDDHGRWTSEGGGVGPDGPLDVPHDPMSYPGGFNPNDVTAGPLTANEKLYWVAASRDRLQAIRDHALVPGTIGNKLLMGMMLDQPPTAVPMYRGVRMATGSTNPGYNPLAFKAGQSVDLQLSSYSTDKGEALLYARSSLGRTGESTDKAFVGDKGQISTLIEVLPGAAGYNIGPTFKGNPGDEVISAGRYNVVSTTMRNESVSTPGLSEPVNLSGMIRVVTLQQTGVIDAQSGGQWARDDWADFAGASA